MTAIECISADGSALLPMIIWPAATHRSNWTTYSTPGWHYACSDSGYTDSTISLEWFKRVFDPQTKERAGNRPRILICDGFGTHETLEILEFCFENNIILCRIPSHTSHKLQPCDVAVVGPLKTAYREQVEQLYRGGSNTVSKEHFTSLYSPAREKALTPRNIKAGWVKAGLYPFNPDRVLRDMQRPEATLTIRKPNALIQEDAIQTPVTAEHVVALQNLIEQNTCELEGTSRRHIQKLVNAAQTSIAECALLEDENKLLYKQNDEVKRRRATKLTVVGKAKVMSYEDIEEAKAKRAKKESRKDDVTSKRKSCQKRKSSVAAVLELQSTKKARKSEIEVAQDDIAAAGMEHYQ